jgi:hypothetical protein
MPERCISLAQTCVNQFRMRISESKRCIFLSQSRAIEAQRCAPEPKRSAFRPDPRPAGPKGYLAQAQWTAVVPSVRGSRPEARDRPREGTARRRPWARVRWRDPFPRLERSVLSPETSSASAKDAAQTVVTELLEGGDQSVDAASLASPASSPHPLVEAHAAERVGGVKSAPNRMGGPEWPRDLAKFAWYR